MKYIKKIDELYKPDNGANEILDDLRIKWRVGKDHLGNNGVYLFDYKGYTFELIWFNGDAYHMRYGKDGKWIKDFNTMNLKRSLNEIK